MNNQLLWAVVEADPTIFPTNGPPTRLICTPNGVLYVTLTGGGNVPFDNIAYDGSDLGVPIETLAVTNFGYGFNGLAAEAIKTASADNISQVNQTGVQIVTGPGNWAINHTPAANTQATIERAAGAGTVRHVCTSIAASFIVDTAGVPVTTLLNLRDGATGAGAILWSKRVSFAGMAIGAFVQIDLSGLQIFGSAATPMTLEFSAAGGANTFESVALTGYDVA